MPCIFVGNDLKITVDSRKIACIKRHAKKPGGIARAYYIPLYSSEVQHLGISENSLIRAEIARVDRSDATSRPAHELEAELEKIRNGLTKILSEYSDETAIRKGPLVAKIGKLIGQSRHIDSEQVSSKPEPVPQIHLG